MVDIFLPRKVYREATAKLWESQQHSALADAWEKQTRDRLAQMTASSPLPDASVATIASPTMSAGPTALAAPPTRDDYRTSGRAFPSGLGGGAEPSASDPLGLGSPMPSLGVPVRSVTPPPPPRPLPRSESTDTGFYRDSGMGASTDIDPGFSRNRGVGGTTDSDPGFYREASSLSGAANPEASTEEVEAYIRAAAKARGIDPEVALTVADSEGGRVPARRGTFATGSSWWPFQLHYGGAGYENLGTTAGMGNSFTAKTGFQPGDPAAWKAATDYALDAVKANGWGAWYGAKARGITGFTGVDRNAPTAPLDADFDQASASARPKSSGSLDVQGILKNYEGLNYAYGGPGGRTDTREGIPTDCSGFASAIMRNRYGVELIPHTDGSYNQLKQLGAAQVGLNDAREGDVVYYMGAGTGGQITHHMGIYAGNGKVLDMSSGGGTNGAAVRPVGWAGEFVILRDPRVNSADPSSATTPPAVQPSGIAEKVGGPLAKNDLSDFDQAGASARPESAGDDWAARARQRFGLGAPAADPLKNPLADPLAFLGEYGDRLTSKGPLEHIGDSLGAIGRATEPARDALGTGISNLPVGITSPLTVGDIGKEIENLPNTREQVREGLATVGAYGINDSRGAAGVLTRIADKMARGEQLTAQDRLDMEEAQMVVGGSVGPAGSVKPPTSRLYHGTNEAFDAFDPARTGSNRDAGLFGRGVYLTETPEVAEKYGSRVLEVEAGLRKPYQWPEGAGNARTEALGTKRLPADIRAEVMQRYDTLAPPRTATASGWGSVGGQADDVLDEPSLAQAITDTLRARGHDGVVYQNPYAKGRQAESVVFDAAQAQVSQPRGAGLIRPASDVLPTQRSGESTGDYVRRTGFLPSGQDAPAGAVRPPQAPKSAGSIAADVLPRMSGTAAEQAAVGAQQRGTSWAGNVLLTKFPEEVRPLLTRAADTFDEFAGQRRGVISDPEAAKNAARVALGTPVEDWLKTKPGKAFNQESAIALGQTLTKLGDDLDVAQAAYRAAVEAGTVTPAMRQELADQALQFAAMAGVRSGAAAEAGRALRSYRQALTGQGASRERMVARAFNAIGTDAEKFDDWVTKWSTTAPDDVTGRYALLQALHQPTKMDKLLAWTTSNMLSGTKTLEVNVVGGATETLNRPLVSLLGGRWHEAADDVVAMGRAITEAWGNAGTAFTTGIRPSRATAILDSGKFDKIKPDAFAGKSGILATPALRTMSATDEFIRTLNVAGAAANLARREARKTGKTVQEILAKPSDDFLREVQDVADKAVFEGKGSPVGDAIVWLRSRANEEGAGNRVAGMSTHVLMPFVRIPEQILMRGTRMLPGVNEATGVYRAVQGLKKGDPEAIREAFGKTALITALNVGIYGHVVAGNITGDGPKDWNKRKSLEEARDANGNPVWQAHSIRVGDRWIDYSNLGPVAIPLGVISNAVDAYREEGKRVTPDVVAAMVSRTAKTMLDASYIRSIGDLFKSIGEQRADKAAAGLITNTASRFIPLSGLEAQAARSVNQDQKDPRNFGEALKARIPFTVDQVPNKPSAFGGDVQRPTDLLSEALPFRTSAPGEPDPVALAFATAGMGAPEAPAKATYRGYGVTLTEEEQKQYTRFLGDELDKRLTPIVSAESWAKLSPAEQEKRIKFYLDHAREVAATKMIQSIPGEERSRRQAAEREREKSKSLVPAR